ncbi:MAG TPA: FliM/FliN family flagellar motor switch protein, partial [Myxococcaceae bacterium]|nr:FliM/FliN family flagellar motor switch protein [Myxococcaceae bacterium]
PRQEMAAEEDPEISPQDVTNPRGHMPHEENEHVSENGEGMDLLNDVPLQVAVELGRIPVSAEDIVALKVGQVVDLNRVPGEPVEMSVNGKVVARGELVEIEGHLGVRILSLIG